jgi:N-glycosylase/DNA lyase
MTQRRDKKKANVHMYKMYVFVYIQFISLEIWVGKKRHRSLPNREMSRLSHHHTHIFQCMFIWALISWSLSHLHSNERWNFFFSLFFSLTDKNDVLLFYSHVRHACQSNKRLEHAKATQSRFHLERCARRLIGHDHLSCTVQVSIYIWVCELRLHPFIYIYIE